jgi:hypothetical protein
MGRWGKYNFRLDKLWKLSVSDVLLQRTEPFVDVNKIPIIKKAVKPISEQESNESRTVWKEVTAGLR